MKVIYEKPSILDKINEASRRAERIKNPIKEVRLSSSEMDSLVVELDGINDRECYLPRKDYCPRSVTFKGFNVVEVFDIEE